MARSQNLSDEYRDYLAAVGLVATNWSFLEVLLQSVVSKLAGLEIRKSLTLTAPSSITGWLDMIRNLARDDPAYAIRQEEIKALAKRILDTQVQRNMVVHSHWFMPFAEPVLADLRAKDRVVRRLIDFAFGFSVPRKGKNVFALIVTYKPEILQIAHSISSLNADVSEFFDVQLQWPDKPRVLRLMETQIRRPNPAKRKTPQAPSRE